MRVLGEGIRNLAFFDGLIGNIPNVSRLPEKSQTCVITAKRLKLYYGRISQQ